MGKVVDEVFIIQFKNETLEDQLLKNDAYKTFEIAEHTLFKGRYEKQLNGIYEREGAYWKYAKILKMNVIG